MCVIIICSYQPAPFFVLDEVDAALDNTNIGKVKAIKYMIDTSRGNSILFLSVLMFYFSLYILMSFAVRLLPLQRRFCISVVHCLCCLKRKEMN